MANKDKSEMIGSKEIIQDRFKRELGSIVDVSIPGYGNTNGGNTMGAPRNSFEYYAYFLAYFTWDGIVEILRKVGFLRQGRCSSQKRLHGKTVVITGANTGIGLTTASFLWKRGADVVITSRNLQKGEAALEEMKNSLTPEDRTGSLRMVMLDLASFESIRSCAKHLLSSLITIDILINNAGIMIPPFGLTEDGFELQFGTNYLGHFLFTLLLLPKIVRSAPARIVNVASVAQCFYKQLDLDIMNEPSRYYGLHAYFRSKAAIVMFTRELAKKLEGTGVNVYSLNPGYVKTELYKYGNETLFPGFLWVKKYFLNWAVLKNAWVGSQTTIHCAICEKADQQTGLYYNECRPKKPNKLCEDDKLCRELWLKSLEWVDLEDVDISLYKKKNNQEAEEITSLPE